MKSSERLFFKKHKAQIWVETVIYILIAFVMIGLVLSFVKPKIEELRDKAIIEQSIEIMNNLDNIFSEMLIPGNKRVVEIGIKKGEFIIVASEDRIEFEIQSRYLYSEPGETIYVGNLNVTTTDLGKYADVKITRDYSSQYNIAYQNSEETKIITKSSVPYRFVITNEGEDVSGKIKINMDLM